MSTLGSESAETGSPMCAVSLRSKETQRQRFSFSLVIAFPTGCHSSVLICSDIPRIVTTTMDGGGQLVPGSAASISVPEKVSGLLHFIFSSFSPRSRRAQLSTRRPSERAAGTPRGPSQGHPAGQRGIGPGTLVSRITFLDSCLQ